MTFPLWSILPFICLLASIAIVPLVFRGWWDKNSNKLQLSLDLSMPVLTVVLPNASDLLIESLELAGLMKDGKCHFDLMKVQHHGSSHSTTQDFFDRVTADRYVISGNGKHEIPHEQALGWLSAARHGQPYECYLTNRIGILKNRQVLDKFLASEQKSEKKHVYYFRNEKALSISVPLA